jgi:hypothetical protein
MSILGDDDSLLGSTPSGSENNYIASLGRISGKLLTENLLRNGVDLAFNTDLLYLNVTDGRIGLNVDSPTYDLDVASDMLTTDLVATTNAYLDNILIANNQFSTTIGGIIVRPLNTSPEVLFNQLATSSLTFNDNVLGSVSNQQIRLQSSTTGSVTNVIKLENDTNITGSLGVSGNVSLDGNLSPDGNIFIGDSALDLLQIATSIPQSLNPGTTLTFDLGLIDRRWGTVHSPDWTNITTISPFQTTVNNQLFLGGANNSILATQTNTDLILNPDSGITVIEQTQWESSDITNLANTALIFSSTGIGYTRFEGTNGVVLPFGNTSNRPVNPEVGDTRWNTDEDYLEVFDGTVYLIATGPGESVTVEVMQDLSNIYSLILG